MRRADMRRNAFSTLLTIIGVVCVVIAVYGLYGIYKQYKVGEEIYNKAEEEYVQVIVPETEETEVSETESETEPETEPETSTGTESEKQETESTAPEEKPRAPWYQRIAVNLEGLQSKYKEVVGWIFFEDDDLSYPVMQTTDNKKYIRTAYDGSYAHSGSIFMEATHKGDFSGMHTIVYGHNQKDKNMFGKLKYYKKKEGYYEGHQYFQIFCEDKIYRYQIFAYQVVNTDSFIFKEKFTSPTELAAKIMENSMINPGIEINEDDKIVNLITCTDDTLRRFVVSAVLVETYNRTDGTLIKN